MMSTAAGLTIDARPLVAASIYMAACVLIAELVSSIVWQPYLVSEWCGEGHCNAAH